jgi:hypothetical protein
MKSISNCDGKDATNVSLGLFWSVVYTKLYIKLTANACNQ